MASLGRDVRTTTLVPALHCVSQGREVTPRRLSRKSWLLVLGTRQGRAAQRTHLRMAGRGAGPHRPLRGTQGKPAQRAAVRHASAVLGSSFHCRQCMITQQSGAWPTVCLQKSLALDKSATAHLAENLPDDLLVAPVGQPAQDKQVALLVHRRALLHVLLQDLEYQLQQAQAMPLSVLQSLASVCKLESQCLTPALLVQS